MILKISFVDIFNSNFTHFLIASIYEKKLIDFFINLKNNYLKNTVIKAGKNNDINYLFNAETFIF